MLNPIQLLLTPWMAALLLFILPIPSGKTLKKIAVVLSLLLLALLLFGHSRWLGADANHPWLPGLNVRFHLHVDSLSLLFLFLTAVIVPISLMVVDTKATVASKAFYGWVLILQGLLVGFFTAADLFVFTLFWEAMLLPLFFLISGWGEEHRREAAWQFLLYMIAGSLLLVLAVLSLYFVSGTFDIAALSAFAKQSSVPLWIGAIFLLAFAVKTPLFPFHAWLPEAYTQASITGTILLSAVLSKAGIYGIARLGVGVFPQLLQQWSPWLLALAIVGVLYGGLAAWAQRDYKRLIAYSSFSHVNVILAGLFVWDQTAHAGALLQAINHALTITALFIVAHWLEQRIGSTTIGPVSGAASWLPRLCWLTLFFVLASVALPGTNNFVGELLIFYGLFGYSPWLTATLALTMILSVIYMLRWMQKTYFNPIQQPATAHADIAWPQWLVAAPLVLLILWIGIYPAPLLKQISSTTSGVSWAMPSSPQR